MCKVVPEIVEGNIVNQTPFFFVGSRFERAKPVVDASLGKPRGALRTKYKGAVLVPISLLEVRVQGTPHSPVVICPLNSPQKVCSVTSFLVRDSVSWILVVFLRSMSDSEAFKPYKGERRLVG